MLLFLAHLDPTPAKAEAIRLFGSGTAACPCALVGLLLTAVQKCFCDCASLRSVKQPGRHAS